MKTYLIALLAAVSAGMAFGSSALLPDNRKSVIYFGWDTLGATTADVYNQRAEFAETGFDGICMPLTGFTEKGAEFKGRLPMVNFRFKREHFAASIAQIKEMSKLPGLSESYLMVYWMSTPRMHWDNDEQWDVFCANMRLLAEIAKETGLKGLFVDHEDYTGKPLFTWRPKDDPPYEETLKLARKRGRDMIIATAAGFPGGAIINDRLLMQNADCARSQQLSETLRMRGDIWTAFVNGVIEAKPDDFGFHDGCEHSYGSKTEKDYLAAKCNSMLTGLQFVEPQLRGKFLSSTRVYFAKWIDGWFQKKKLPFDPGKFTESMWAAGLLCDGLYWVYGEQNSIVKWRRKVHPRVDNNMTWNEKIPDFRCILRTSVGDYSFLRERVANGEFKSILPNGVCDSPKGGIPAPYGTWVDKANKRDGMFAWDGAVGCGKPGSLRLIGKGCFIMEVKGLKPYDRIYVRLAAKGDNPNANVVWRTKGAYEWYLDYQFLVRPMSVDKNGWKHYEIAMNVPAKAVAHVAGDNPNSPPPEEVDAVGLILGRHGDAESPVWFDDIEIYKW